MHKEFKNVPSSIDSNSFNFLLYSNWHIILIKSKLTIFELIFSLPCSSGNIHAHKNLIIIHPDSVKFPIPFISRLLLQNTLFKGIFYYAL